MPFIISLPGYATVSEENKNIASAGRRQKKKSRRPADIFPRAYEAAALRNQGRRFFLPIWGITAIK